MRNVLENTKHMFLGVALFGGLVGLAPPGLAQTTKVTYVLDDVWLLPDITHPWESAQQMTGSFEWAYVPGDFENGSGQFVDLYIPWYGSDLPALNITVEQSSIEFVLPGNYHDTGLDLTLRLLQPLSLIQPSAIDVNLSMFDIQQVGISRKGHVVSGSVIPEADFLSYCFGDDTGTACPCSNPGGVGEGCANSSGAGGLLTAGGSASVGADDLTFAASNLLPGQPGLLFCGLNPVNGGAGSTFGDGLRCAGGGVVRLGVGMPDASGDASWGPGLAAKGGWAAGETHYFQCWYRDPAGPPCGTAFNLTHGVAMTSVP